MLGNIYHKLNNTENALKYWIKTIDYDQERPEGIVKVMEFFYNMDAHLVVQGYTNVPT